MVVAMEKDGREHARGGGAAPPHQAALGALINIAGRQRMLSHRAVMFLALSQASDEAETAVLLGEAGVALSSFDAGVQLLLHGDSAQSAPPLCSARVREILVQPAGRGMIGGRVLEAFVTEGRACVDLLRAGDGGCGRQVRALAELAGGVLLPLLNAIVAAFEADLADALGVEAERAADVRAVMGRALDDIERTASKIQLIAFNALIEAARAGDAGRAFSVIAEEIKNLGAQTRAESAKMQAAMARLFEM